ncbi:MAG: threonine synthase [Clostridiales bacterium]|nr:threonine synthase [Clostridiales bacterium]
MNYFSTRAKTRENEKTASQVIIRGLADDGGLYMPENIPQIDGGFIKGLCGLKYYERAAKALSLFLTDYTEQELLSCADMAYNYTFDGYNTKISPLKDGVRMLELWHGPTCAFKDMALQIMPKLLSKALEKTGEQKTALILVATSGDTGKAALEGYKDVKGIKIAVFYPQNGVSRMQKLQMATQEGQNVSVFAIIGNFDDAQSGVKAIFSSESVKKALEEKNTFLSSANSINWGRLAPQIAYYISAYCDLVNEKDITNGEKVNITVPTGNFGNIFAAYIAKLMGLPVNKLICASNSNNILTDFLSTGIYDRNRKFYTTMSPSMDILISSNLERLLYLVAGPEKTAFYMKELSEKGRYEVDKSALDKIKETFCAYFATEDECRKTIKETFDEQNYLCDTHTAVAMSAAEKFKNEHGCAKKNIVVSTASPYKFAPDVLSSLGRSAKNPDDDKDVINALSEYTKTAVPKPISELFGKKIRFDKVLEKTEMQSSVLEL